MKKNKILNSGLIGGLLISVIFIGGCVPAGEPGAPGAEASTWATMLIPLILIVAIFYFLMIRPQRKKQKEHQQLVEELKRGDKVITAGGIYGVIESTSEDSIVIKVESGTTLRIARNSVTIKRER